MTPAETLKAVRNVLFRLTWGITEVLDGETQDALHKQGLATLAAMDRLESVEGVAFLDGDFFCTEGEGGKCQEAWLMVPGCEHEPDYKACGGELPALLLTVKAET